MLLLLQCFVKSEKEGQSAVMGEGQFGLVTDASASEDGAGADGWTGGAMMGGEVRLR